MAAVVAGVANDCVYCNECTPIEIGGDDSSSSSSFHDDEDKAIPAPLPPSSSRSMDGERNIGRTFAGITTEYRDSLLGNSPLEANWDVVMRDGEKNRSWIVNAANVDRSAVRSTKARTLRMTRGVVVAPTIRRRANGSLASCRTR